MSLLPHHAEMLAKSAISGTVARERGYFSATEPKQLDRWFGTTQRKLVPSLVIPTYDVRGEVAFCQLRPDEPRVVKGKRRKYELPAGAHMVVDVPPRIRPILGDPQAPLVVTEGARKADAAVSAGLYAIDLVGVTTWRGTNGDGGKTALADWEHIALNGRVIYLAFDSDAMEKVEVHRALERFSAFLRHREASVRIVYLPPGDGGQKVGLDDYLAAGHGRDDVLALATDELRPLPGDASSKPGRPSVPAPETARLLGEVGKLVRRFVILPSPASYLTIALFVVHTWAFDAAHATPYLVVESPEKQSGKTRLLEVLELVCRNPLKVASITAAALFQSVDGLHPTLLIDEADAIFAGHSERNEDLRAVLNAGNAPGSVVIRGGKDGSPLTYEVFCPKVIAGIATGKLPDTVRDRAIIVPIDRKLRREQVQRLRRRLLQAEIGALSDQLRAWADKHRDSLVNYDLPAPLEKISDRMEEAWEPLLAIADLAGDEIAQKARAAAEGLAESTEDDATAAHALLMAMRDLFDDRDPISSKDIVAALHENDELPFGAWNDGNGIKPAEIARLLKRYRIKPRVVRLKGTDATARGYHREQFITAWERYGADLDVTAVTSQCSPGIPGFRETSHDPDCYVSQNAENPRPIRDVTGVTSETGGIHAYSDATPEEGDERLADLRRRYVEGEQ